MKASELLDQLQSEFKAQSKLLTQITLEAELQLQVATDTKNRIDKLKSFIKVDMFGAVHYGFERDMTEEEMKEVGFENSEE